MNRKSLKYTKEYVQNILSPKSLAGLSRHVKTL